MYHIITKNEYFQALDNIDIDKSLENTCHLGLKHIQDACILQHLAQHAPSTVAEIGGGHSRTLPFLYKRGWQCHNIDTFEGLGNGPKTPIMQEGISIIHALLGNLELTAYTEYFDIVYSVSVVEHLLTNAVDDFFHDMHRILKHGGRAYHAIDIYLEDESTDWATKQIETIYNSAIQAGFKFIANEPMPLGKFSCVYATNPDLTIRQWNKSVPELIDKRMKSQSVSLMLGLHKSL